MPTVVGRGAGPVGAARRRPLTHRYRTAARASVRGHRAVRSQATTTHPSVPSGKLAGADQEREDRLHGLDRRRRHRPTGNDGATA